MSTGYVWHELYGWHDTGSSAGFVYGNAPAGLQPFRHYESADSKKRLHELVAMCGLEDDLVRVVPEPASDDDLLLVHDRAHVERIAAESRLPKGGDAGDGFSPFGQGGDEIARLAAGGTIAATRAVLEGRVDNAYALVRPPGHHALPHMGMGFCVFANVAIAARVARARLGAGRIAVVDWDVHHGNGTQAIFYDDPTTLAISIHQDNWFPPDSGHLHERGTGDGEGATLNVPLPPGSGNGAYLAVMDQVVLPALERFRPDLILVACGFDANVLDPLARMMVTSTAYRTMTSLLLDAASAICGGRIVFSHEGGYSEIYVPFCGLAVIEALAGTKSTVEDPFVGLLDEIGGQPLQPHQAAVITQAADLLAGIPAAG
ncbi:MAG TPA: class II histone deacetylase [Acidimicrobiia bacterium]|nr:class II histone deacetylase [Acidimicrobiia bacterium]